MPATLPYLSSNKNLAILFAKIGSAKVPDNFTHKFLQQTIGLKGANDRPLIPLLRNLGLLDASNTPTPAYRQMKNAPTAKAALGAAIRRAYSPLFEADEQANTLGSEKLKGLVAQVAGTDDDMTARIVATFSTLTKLATFDAVRPEAELEPKSESVQADAPDPAPVPSTGSLRPEFHYNIQIHLPANGTEDVYLNIFNAIRKVFQ
jgi:hypothetical protein